MRFLASLLLLLLPAVATSQVLSPGDIAIVGLYHDGPDAFAFVALDDLPAGTTVSFTENGWLSAGGFRASAEGTMTWTADTPVAAGTVVTFTCLADDPAAAATPSTGSNTGSLCGLSTGGDQIIAYQGDAASPTLLYAVNNEGTGWQADATSSNTSALPAGLTDGLTAIALPEADNYAYTGTTSGSADELLAAIGNPSNWTGNDDRSLAASFPSSFTVAGASGATTVRWVTSAQTIGEGDASVWAVAALSQPSTGTLSVNVSAGGSATVDADFTLDKTELHFGPGATRDSLRVTVIDDANAEADESLSLSFTQPTAGLGIGAPGTLTFTLSDNDAVPQQEVLFPGVTGPALLDSLRRVYTPQTLGYTEARRYLYGYIWNDNGLVEGLYTGYQVAVPAGSADATTIAFNKGLNTEHAWPQSKGAGDEPQRSNLFNLYPTRIDVNSDRANLPFGEIPDAQATDWYYLDVRQSSVPADNLDAWSERNTTLFEPREAVKGDMARGLFYFYALYAGVSDKSFFDGMKTDLRLWHRTDAVSTTERTRHDRIAEVQGKANPFVLDSSLVRRAFFSTQDPVEPEPPTETYLTMAEARQLGSGATVQVRGLVTRTLGAFTYFQDETGGLVIRQTGGGFFDDVNNGQIAPGDSLAVEGTLSTFNNLLQINGTGLASYRVSARGNAIPAPVVVAPQEIVSNGEAYESRLIQVEGLRFSDTGTFAAARTYQATAAGVTLDIRIGNANDTEVDGLPIPEFATFTGVLGQFSSTAPDAGYQLMPIAASDLVPLATNLEDVLPATFRLHGVAPLPATEAVTLLLDLPHPARLLVRVYDVTGRQVLAAESAAGSGTSIPWLLNTAALSPGVYLYRITADADAYVGQATGRLVIVR